MQNSPVIAQDLRRVREDPSQAPSNVLEATRQAQNTGLRQVYTADKARAPEPELNADFKYMIIRAAITLVGLSAFTLAVFTAGTTSLALGVVGLCCIAAHYYTEYQYTKKQDQTSDAKSNSKNQKTGVANPIAPCEEPESGPMSELPQLGSGMDGDAGPAPGYAAMPRYKNKPVRE